MKSRKNNHKLKRIVKNQRVELSNIHNKRKSVNKDEHPAAYYKYTSQAVVKMFIKNKNIKFTNPLQFNDPMDSTIPELAIDEEKVADMLIDFIQPDSRESRIPIHIKKRMITDMRRTKRELCEDFKEMQQRWRDYLSNYRILSLTTKSNNVLMWSHYANEHKGVVIKFKSKLSFGTPKVVDYANGPVLISRVMHNVLRYMVKSYVKDRESKDECIDRVGIYMYHAMAVYLIMKRSDWEYESEHRIVKFSNDKSITTFGKHDLVNVTTDDVDAIIIGAAVPPIRAKRLKMLIQGRMPGVRVHKYELHGWRLHLIEDF